MSAQGIRDGLLEKVTWNPRVSTSRAESGNSKCRDIYMEAGTLLLTDVAAEGYVA